MASCRTFASLALSTAFVATSVILVDLPRSRAQEPAPDARRQEPPNAQPNAPASQPPQAGEQPRLIFSPWTKFCLKGREANAKQVCFTGKDGRVESGIPVVAAVLIEPESDPKKVLRVTLPLGMSLQPGARVVVDNGQPMTGPYVTCFNNGCMADIAVGPDFVDGLKKGLLLTVEAKSLSGSACRWAVSRKPMTGRRPTQRCSQSSRRTMVAHLGRTIGWTRRYSGGQFSSELRGR